MNREDDYSSMSKELLQQLPQGAFLTVKFGSRVNTMTIGWGSIGFIWGRPVFTVMVRKSRYTHELIENASDFTVSVPLNGALKDELSLCGTKSGRDIDKINESGLKLREGQKTESPVIDGCDIYVECKIVYKQAMDSGNLDRGIERSSYPSGDYHTFYCGKIEKIYSD